MFRLKENELFQAESEYNAWEEDIAVVNIFFGKETIMGEIKLWNIILFFNAWMIRLLPFNIAVAFPVKSFFFCRNGKEDQNGSNRVHLVPGRPLWTLSWLQLHLFFRNRLLGDQSRFQVFFHHFYWLALSYPGIIGKILGEFELWPEANEISFKDTKFQRNKEKNFAKARWTQALSTFI